jgi:hypothetical protein
MEEANGKKEIYLGNGTSIDEQNSPKNGRDGSGKQQ